MAHGANQSIIIEAVRGEAHQTAGRQQLMSSHLQPVSLLADLSSRSLNISHLALDELTNSIYVGATNWLLQLSAADLRPQVALRTGPARAGEQSRDCSPADCQFQPQPVDLEEALPALLHSPGPSYELLRSLASRRPSSPLAGGTMHTVNGTHLADRMQQQRLGAATTGSPAAASSPGSAQSTASPGGSSSSSASQQQLQSNNYNKILAIDYDSRQLIVCGSLSQGACRRHKLGQLAHHGELIPLPVASNDEHSSTVALVAAPSPRAGGGSHSKPVLYVAATNSRLGPYREMVPAIGARHLAHPTRAMQLIERSFTDSARVDVSFELRDYYLVNYVHSFQHGDFIYFATVQRRSPLRQLEELGYITRLARLCLADLSFQSYVEMSLECKSSQAGRETNFNLIQDAHLMASGSQLQQHFNLRHRHAPILAATFAQSRDHTTRSSQRSAICLFPIELIEQRFQENINTCYNGSAKARNMNYIAGSVNDCPKPTGVSIPMLASSRFVDRLPHLGPKSIFITSESDRRQSRRTRRPAGPHSASRMQMASRFVGQIMRPRSELPAKSGTNHSGPSGFPPSGLIGA